MSKTWAEKLVEAVERDREAHPERWVGAPPLYGPPVDLSEYPLAHGVTGGVTPEVTVTGNTSVNTSGNTDRRASRLAYLREYMRRKRAKG